MFNAAKLSTIFLPPAAEFMPVDGRKYTLTHSDATGNLFLSIGYRYNLASINIKSRDEFLAEWIAQNSQYLLKGKVYVSGGDFDEQSSKKRFLTFQQEIPLALTAIFYGDRNFYSHYPQLLDSPIFIQFESIYPQFNQVLYYGIPRQYIHSRFYQPIQIYKRITSINNSGKNRPSSR